MNIVIASDHAGFQLKEKLKKFLQQNNHIVTDFGAYNEDSCDYPDFALLVGEAVASKQFDKGILINGTGGGMCMAVNKIPNVRAVLAYNEITARYASEHDDANVLCLGGKMIGELLAIEIVKNWLNTQFAGERHLRRLLKVSEIEKKYLSIK